MARRDPKKPSPEQKPVRTRRKRPLDERIAIVHEINKTVRAAIFTSGAVGATWIVVDGLVKMADNPWVAALKILLSVGGASVVPSLIIKIYIDRTKQFTSDTASRIQKLELEKDPQRTSSALLKDGTDPPGAIQ
jgi:hypothetical protein